MTAAGRRHRDPQRPRHRRRDRPADLRGRAAGRYPAAHGPSPRRRARRLPHHGQRGVAHPRVGRARSTRRAATAPSSARSRDRAPASATGGSPEGPGHFALDLSSGTPGPRPPPRHRAHHRPARPPPPHQLVPRLPGAARARGAAPRHVAVRGRGHDRGRRRHGRHRPHRPRRRPPRRPRRRRAPHVPARPRPARAAGRRDHRASPSTTRASRSPGSPPPWSSARRWCSSSPVPRTRPGSPPAPAAPGPSPSCSRAPVRSWSRTTTPATSPRASWSASAGGCPAQTVHVRSFSKSHGPDLRLAAVGGAAEVIDAVTTRRMLGPGWSSRILQSVLLAMLGDPKTIEQIEAARRHLRSPPGDVRRGARRARHRHHRHRRHQPVGAGRRRALHGRRPGRAGHRRRPRHAVPGAPRCRPRPHHGRASSPTAPTAPAAWPSSSRGLTRPSAHTPAAADPTARSPTTT